MFNQFLLFSCSSKTASCSSDTRDLYPEVLVWHVWQRNLPVWHRGRQGLLGTPVIQEDMQLECFPEMGRLQVPVSKWT